jgi:NADH:quinone reductase (non-electrogenic)
MTDKPFGVNLTLLPAMVPPDYGAYAQVIIDEGIRIVETAGNSPGPVIKQLKAANCTILHKCTTIRHAQSAVKLGVDFLSIDGFECAGHVGESDITNFILLSRARQSLGVPFIASGGFADGQGLAAALSLGAEGINMGTRFMCTVEAPIHLNIKQAIVDAQETDTELVLRRWKNTSRLFANKVAKEAVKIEKESTTGKFQEVAPFVSGKRGRQVFLNGDKDFGVSFITLLLARRFFAPDLDSRTKPCPYSQVIGALTGVSFLFQLGLDCRPGDRIDSRYTNMCRTGGQD